MVHHITEIKIVAPEEENSMETNNDTISPKNNKSMKPLKRNKYGETGLHVACRTGNVQKLEAILKTGPLDINDRDFNGWTPLHEACNSGKVECVKLLLQNHADITLVAGDYKINPLQDAVQSGKIEVAQVLLGHLHKTNQLNGMLVAINNNGPSLIDLASSPEIRDVINDWAKKKGGNGVVTLKNPELFYFLSSMAIYKYIAMYKLHAVKTIIKGVGLNQSQEDPQFELGLHWPYRPLKNSVMCNYPFKRTRETLAKDIKTFWDHLIRNPYVNPEHLHKIRNLNVFSQKSDK